VNGAPCCLKGGLGPGATTTAATTKKVVPLPIGALTSAVAEEGEPVLASIYL